MVLYRALAAYFFLLALLLLLLDFLLELELFFEPLELPDLVGIFLSFRRGNR